MIAREFRDVSIIAIDSQKFDSRSTLVFEEDGTAYRRIASSESDDYIDVPLIGSALDYERRVMEARQQMYEADAIARNSHKSR